MVQKVNIPNYNQPTAGLRAAVGVTIEYGGLQLLPGPKEDTRWLSGLQATTSPCGGLTVYGTECDIVSEDVSDIQKPLTFHQENSIKTRVDVGCSTWPGITEDELADSARNLVEQKMFNAIGREIYSGEAARNKNIANRYLALSGNQPSPLVKLNGDTALCLTEAVGLLESYLLDQTGQGIIHVPSASMSQLLCHNIALSDSSNRLFSATGQQFVTSPGYSGVGPDSYENGPVTPTDGQFWLYGTGPMVVKAGATLPEEYVDMLQNNRSFSVDGAFLYIWGCTHAAVLVDLCS